MSALAAKRPLAGGFSRRGACPALSAPMATGDGLLVRLNPMAGGLSPKAMTGLCEAAEMHGNGVIEVTARGSVQIRGLTELSSVEFAAAVNDLGIAVRTGVPVQTGVLAGLDPDETADPTALAEMIRAGIAEAGLEEQARAEGLGGDRWRRTDGAGRGRGGCPADGGRRPRFSGMADNRCRRRKDGQTARAGRERSGSLRGGAGAVVRDRRDGARSACQGFG